MRAVLSFILMVVAALAVDLVVPVSAQAGECRVEKPDQDTIDDANALRKLNQFELDLLDLRVEAATGRRPEIVIVARAGQDLSNQTVLRDVDAQGRRLEMRAMVEAAEKSPSSRPPGVNGDPQFSFGALKETIKNQYGDPSRKLEYSHIGFLIRRHPKAPKPEDPSMEPLWLVRHMLRPCDNPEAETAIEKLMQKDLNRPFLHDEGQGRFFADDPVALRSLILVPTPALQDRLLEIVLDDSLVGDQTQIYNLNSEYYNAAASWSNELIVNKNRKKPESNSNQWVLEILAAAMRPKSQVQSRREAQEVLRQTNYWPTRILFAGRAAMVNLPGARMIAPYVTYHSEEQPLFFRANVGEVITALSVEEYMARNGVLSERIEVIGPERTADRKKREQREKSRRTPPLLTGQGH